MVGEDERDVAGQQCHQHRSGKPAPAVSVNHIPALRSATAPGFHGHAQGTRKQGQMPGRFGQKPRTFTQVQRGLSSQFKTAMNHHRMAENAIRIMCLSQDRQNTTIILSGTDQV
jgi:hypothetical protein